MNLIKIAIGCLSLCILVSCTINLMNTRLTPDYPGVDAEIAPYVDQWLILAKEYGLKFNHGVTVGFRDINKGYIVGQCNYGMAFREIDIDRKFWERSSDMSRTILVYHELSHCYCDRDHDKMSKGGCPTSLMYPEVITDICFLYHYQEYIDELFSVCKEY